MPKYGRRSNGSGVNRIICDTNCLISGSLREGGPPARILDRVEAGQDTLLLTHEMVVELSGVIQRSKFKAVMQQVGTNPAEVLLRLIEIALFVDPYPLPGPVIEADPDDDMVLACAATAHPDFIISGDGHLLDLQAFESIPILSPRAYVDQLDPPLQ